MILKYNRKRGSSVLVCPCPRDRSIMISSSSCERCEYHNYHIVHHREVECSWNDISLPKNKKLPVFNAIKLLLLKVEILQKKKFEINMTDGDDNDLIFEIETIIDVARELRCSIREAGKSDVL